MVFKLLGGGLLFLCGALYVGGERKRLDGELSECKSSLALFSDIRDEISDYGRSLSCILRSHGIKCGIEEYVSSLSHPLRLLLSEAKDIGKGYPKESLRLCDGIISKLQKHLDSLTTKHAERLALAKLKAFAPPALILILLA